MPLFLCIAAARFSSPQDPSVLRCTRAMGARQGVVTTHANASLRLCNLSHNCCPLHLPGSLLFSLSLSFPCQTINLTRFTTFSDLQISHHQTATPPTCPKLRRSPAARARPPRPILARRRRVSSRALPHPFPTLTITDPNAPKRGLSAYMFFANDQRDKVREENPGIKFGKSLSVCC